jgi:NAD(P)-dependent dehydrogenase (short-subunit alcohol dehydrogenase family)
LARFTGKVAIITGAGGGIGSATARLLAKEGAQVVLADIDAGAANRVHDQIVGAGGESLVVKLDLADEASIVALIDATLQRFGKIDILDNNAADLSAGLFSLDHDIETMTAEVWDRTFLVNTRGTMLCCKYALAPMRKAGRGAIVNTASNLALQGNIIQAAYSASKAAVIQMTRSIATSHGQAGIRCNAVLPGLTASPTAIDNLPKRLREIVLEETLTPFLGDPMDISCTVAFLVSDEARYITGQAIVADGGTSAHIPGISRLREMMSGGDGA